MKLIASCLVLSSAIAFGQEAPVEAGASDSESQVEEVVVIGRSRAILLRQIELATDATLARFNEINSNDDFDTHCLETQSRGSRIERRVCKPKFRIEADAATTREILRSLQGGMGGSSGLHEFHALIQQEEMADEMRRLVFEDDEFRAAAARLGRLLLSASDDTERDGRGRRTSAVVASSADMPLPYDASLMAEVQIGRNAWRHTLINRSFAIARLYGEIDSMSVRCDDGRASFDYEFDAEWSVPEGWEHCRLTIDAPRGTSFTLFEFQ